MKDIYYSNATVEHMHSFLNHIFVSLLGEQNVSYFCVAIFVLAAFILRHTRAGILICHSAKLTQLASALAGLIIVAYLAEIVIYARYPTFSDHLEPTVASIAWLGLHGNPYYPNWNTGDLYGMLYGPVLFLINGIFLWLSPTLTGAKMAGIVPLLITFALILSLIKAQTNSFLAAILAVASIACVFEHFRQFPYWNRAEPFLILIAVIALFMAVRLRPMLATIAVGSLAGIAAGFKIHGFLYVMPVATMLLADAKDWRQFVIFGAAQISFAIVFFLLPFCVGPSSLEGYFFYLKLSTHHGLSFDLFKETGKFALAIIVPILSMWYWRRPNLLAKERWFFAGLAVAIAVTLVIASKLGAGPHHLLPFTPLSLFGVLALEKDRSTTVVITSLVFLLIVAAYEPSIVSQIKDSRYLLHITPSEQQKVAEINSLIDAYPNSEIGVSDERHYGDSNYKFLSTLKGHPLHVDFAAWMDLEFGGVNENKLVRLVQRDGNGCGIPTWILPLGPPFTMITWYAMRPMIPDEFRRTFYTNYRLAHTGKAFEVWTCRTPNQ